MLGSMNEHPSRRSIPGIKNQEMAQIMKQCDEKTREMFLRIEKEPELMQKKRSDAAEAKKKNPLHRQSTVNQCHEQGLLKTVKYKTAARVLPEPFGLAQEFMDEKLRKNKEGREWLQMHFGDCEILARITALQTKILTIDPDLANDARFNGCREACERVQQVLKEDGLADKFREELEEQRKKVDLFLETGRDQDAEEKAPAATKAVADKEAAEAAAAGPKAKADADAAEKERAEDEVAEKELDEGKAASTVVPHDEARSAKTTCAQKAIRINGIANPQSRVASEDSIALPNKTSDEPVFRASDTSRRQEVGCLGRLAAWICFK